MMGRLDFVVSAIKSRQVSHFTQLNTNHNNTVESPFQQTNSIYSSEELGEMLVVPETHISLHWNQFL